MARLQGQPGLLLGQAQRVLQAAQRVYQAVRQRILARPHAALGHAPHLLYRLPPPGGHLQVAACG